MANCSTVYSCLCGKFFPLDELLYCVGCQGPKCFYCYNEELVASYCRQCMDNVSTTEVTANRSRCAKCFACPRCECVLAVQEGEVCFLRCPVCLWDSRALAVAPSPADLFRALRELERAVGAAGLFRERVTAYVKEAEEVRNLKSKQMRNARTRRAQALLQHTPAKDKFFGKLSFDNVAPGDGTAAAAATKKDFVMNLETLSRLDAMEEEKNVQQFPKPSKTQSSAEQRKLLSGAAATAAGGEDESQSSGPIILPQRLLLCARTSKHCNACDKLLVKGKERYIQVACLLASRSRLYIHFCFLFRRC